MTVATENNEIGRNILSDLQEDFCRFGAARIQDLRSRLHPVARQIEFDIRYVFPGPSIPIVYGRDHDIPGGDQERHSVDDGTSRFPGIIPRNQDAFGLDRRQWVGCHEYRTAGRKDETCRIQHTMTVDHQIGRRRASEDQVGGTRIECKLARGIAYLSAPRGTIAAFDDAQEFLSQAVEATFYLLHLTPQRLGHGLVISAGRQDEMRLRGAEANQVGLESLSKIPCHRDAWRGDCVRVQLNHDRLESHRVIPSAVDATWPSNRGRHLDAGQTRNETGWCRHARTVRKAIGLILIKDTTTNGVNVALWDSERSIDDAHPARTILIRHTIVADCGKCQKLFLAAASLQVHAFKAMMRYNVETLAFLKHRSEQDVKLADDLITGPEFNDAFDIFAAFLQNATSQYVSEAGKVATLTCRVASETAKRVRDEARTAIEDAAAKTVA